MARYGNGRVDGVEVVGPLGLPATMPMLDLRWQPIPIPGEGVGERRVSATFQHVNATKKTTVTISREDFDGTALSDLTFVVTGAAAKSAWSGVLTSSATANASTLKEVMDLFNEIRGLNVEVLHAPYDLDINSATALADVSEVDIPFGVGPESSLRTMYGVNSVTKTSYMRVGLPEPWDAAAFRLVKAEGTCSGTVTTSKFGIYTDNYADYGKTAEYYIKDEILTTARKVYQDYDQLTAPTVSGSLIVKVDGGSSTLSAMDFRIHRIAAQFGS